jgi:hypothetical protein
MRTLLGVVSDILHEIISDVDPASGCWSTAEVGLLPTLQKTILPLISPDDRGIMVL